MTNNPQTTRKFTAKDKAAIAILLGVGLLQMAGDITGLRVIKAIGAASGMAPAPKVFTAVNGLETYSSRFYLQWQDKAGQLQQLALTAAVYGRLEGPYNRRNVYGAVLAYGPVLPPQLRDPVLRYALCGDAPLLRELGIDTTQIAGPVRVVLEPLPGIDLGDLPLVLEVSCQP